MTKVSAKTVFAKKVARLLSVLLITGMTTACGADSERPNILFILTDDQGYIDTGAYGNQVVNTPNIDRLAAQGTTFTQVFNQGSWSPAVCAPSRAMINTGRNLYHTGMNDEAVKGSARPAYPLWGETFRQAGYETFMTGKWHVSKGALLRSFSKGKAVFTGGMTHNHYNAGMVDIDSKTGTLSEVYPSGKHTSELIADAAVEYLQESSDSDKPFMMYVGFLAPHDARQSPQEFVNKYPAEKIPLPENFMLQHSVDQGDFWVRDEILLDIPRNGKEVQGFIGEYYAMVEHADVQIGRILDALEASGQLDNTVVIFTADHGLAVGRHGLLGKQNQYDHSVRVPFIVAGKGVPEGKKVRGNFYLNSLFPTTAEMAGIQVPNSVQAESFLPVLHGKQDQVHQYIYGAYRHYQRMIRDDNYKLVYYPLIGITQLFDLNKDPNELNNLAAYPEHAERLANMQNALQAEMQKLDDPLDFAKPTESYREAGYNVNPWRRSTAKQH